MGRLLTLLGRSRAGGGAAFTYERTLTIDNTGGAAKTDYPVKVSLTSANFDFTQAETDGRDIRFGGAPYWIEAWDSVAQTAVVWVKVASIPANATTTIAMQHGSASAQDAQDPDSVFLFWDGFDDATTMLGDITEGGAGLLFDLDGLSGNPVVTTGGAGSWKESQVREIGPVVYDPADADASRRYKFYYSGMNATGTVSVGVAFSADGRTGWTDHVSNPVVELAEDPYVIKVGSTFHMYYEIKTLDTPSSLLDIGHATSSDGLTWTKDAANPVIARVGSGTDYCSQDTSSPVVMHDGTTFHVLFEGRRESEGHTSVGIARSADGSSFTKSATVPVMSFGDFTWSAGGVMVPDDIVEVDGSWVLLLHGDGSRSVRVITTDAPADWGAGSFADLGVNPYDLEGSTEPMFVAGDPNTLVYTNGARSRVDMVRFGGVKLAASKWNLFRSPSNGLLNADARNTRFSVASSVLSLSHLGSGRRSEVLHTTGLGLTTDWAVHMRRRSLDNSGYRYTSLSVGAGDIVPNTDDRFISYANGYQMWVNIPNGTSGSLRIRKYTEGATVESNGTITEAEASNWNEHRLSMLANGSIAYTIDGTSRATRSDTAHGATAKELAIHQGQWQSAFGAFLEVDWVFARPFDGVDPTVTVGAPA